MKPIAAKTLKMIQYIQDHPDTPVRKLMAKFKVSQATVYKVRSTALERARQFEEESQTNWTVTTTDEGNIVATHSEPAKVEDILDQRGNRYGSFSENAKTTQRLGAVLKAQEGWYRLSDVQKESVEMIMHKISRLVNGDPTYLDTVVDIMGYTELMLKDMKKGPPYGKVEK